MAENREMEQTIQVQMLGGLTIRLGDQVIRDDENRSKKAWNLLSYLILNRNREVSAAELYQALWQDNTEENPYGALKTLIFRVRRMLEAAGIPAQELILSQRRIYRWNTDWDLWLDTEEFEALCAKCLEEGADPEETQESWMRALELYQGKFLPSIAEGGWASAQEALYHGLYKRLVVMVCSWLEKQEAYEQILNISRRAAAIDHFCEDFHYYRILALCQLGSKKEAAEEFHKVTESFYRERLMTPSERFKELYQVICRGLHEMEDFSQIQDQLEQREPGEKELDPGAYECEYAVFKRLYQLERRGVERSGSSVYLCLLTVGNRRGGTLKPDIQMRAMDRLKVSIKDSLRSSDLFARYSVSQYTILLPGITYENSEMVMKRIVSAFNRLYVRKDVVVSYSLSPVLPL